MKTYKNTFWWMLGICIVSLILAIGLEYEWDKELLDLFTSLFTGHRNFIINVFIGVFASALLILISSLVAYFCERKKNIFLYYCAVENLIARMGDFFTDYSEITPAGRRIKYSTEAAERIRGVRQQYTVNIIVLKSSFSFFFSKVFDAKKINRIHDHVYRLNDKFWQLFLPYLQYKGHVIPENSFDLSEIIMILSCQDKNKILVNIRNDLESFDKYLRIAYDENKRKLFEFKEDTTHDIQ